MKLPEITSETEAAFRDIVLAVQGVTVSRPGDWYIAALGQHHGTEVGLTIIVRQGMLPGVVAGRIRGNGFAAEGIVFATLGERSDALVGSLAEFYQVGAVAARMRDRVPFASFALGGDPQK